MLEIPGEEAPTDPGLQARQRKELADRVRKKAEQRRSRAIGFVSLLMILGLGGAAAWRYKTQQASLTYEMDDYYVTPLSELQAAPEIVPAGVPTTGPTPARPQKHPNANAATSVGGATIGGGSSAPEGGPKSAVGGLSTDPVGGGVALAPDGSGLGVGVGDILVQRVGTDVVLTDDHEIYDMLKRVINASSPQLQSCYNQRLKQAEGLKGAWEVAFTVGKDGGAQDVHVSAVNGSDAELEGCMQRSVASWRFQKIVKDQPVRKLYRFGAGSW